MLKLLSLFLGPVFAKEMVEMARRKRYYFNRVLYGLALFFTLWIVWEDHRHVLRNGTVTIRVMAQLAETLFHAVSAIQYAAVFLFVPLFMCGVIASEREEQTLDLLFTTQLNDREIVLGKLASRTVALIILILCALPIMSIIMLFGGVDPDALWRIQAATLLAILFAGAHAIYFSAITKSPMGALVRTYWWMAVYLIGVPAIMMLILSATTRGPGGVPVLMFFLGVLFMINPIAPFIAAMEGFTFNRMASYFGIGEWFFWLSFVVPIGISLVLLWRAVARVRLAPSPFAVFIKRLSPVRALRAASYKLNAAVSRPFQFVQIPVAWIRNPFWLRARRARVYDREGYIGRIQWLAWLLAFVFLLLIVAFHPRELARPDTRIPFLVLCWLVIIMMTVVLSGSSLVGDRRRGFLDLVLMSPLAPREVIDGTLLAIWQHMRRLYWLPVLLTLLFGAMPALLTWVGYIMPALQTWLGPREPSGWGALFCSLVTATLFCALTALYGTIFALAARTIPGSLVPTFIFPVLVNLGIVFLMPIFREGSGPGIWVVSTLALVGTWLWIRRRLTVASVSAFLMAAHLVITSAAVCWTWKGGNHWEYPIAAIHPGFLAFAPLDSRSGDWYHGINAPRPAVPPPPMRPGNVPMRFVPPPPPPRGMDKEVLLLVCYWSALLINFAWARWWAIRNFERLAERTHVAKQLVPLSRLFRRKPDPSPAEALVEPQVQ